MEAAPIRWLNWLAGPEPRDRPTHLFARWLFLRALGLIYFSAFYSWLFQIRGLIGPQGILPAGRYLELVHRQLGAMGYWYAPTLLWIRSGRHALEILCWAGMAASLFIVLNLWPRASLFVSFIAFLSIIAAAQDFASYQSDGMLLEAGFIALFFAPAGLRPGLATARAPSRISLFLLQWEWFRIYFESGVAKIAGGDPEWRHLTAMDQYYQNGPLPTWIGWYVQQLPHRFHAATALGTLILEVGVVCMLFLPRRWKILCFCIVTPWEIGIILTANYAFLNYLVLSLGVLLLDDKVLLFVCPSHWRDRLKMATSQSTPLEPAGGTTLTETKEGGSLPRGKLIPIARLGTVLALGWILYATMAQLVWMLPGDFGMWLPTKPVSLLDPFRIANQYGLFGRMTLDRFEIEFQGSNDGTNWTPYLFRFKPQALDEPPGIYAPYQPRFDWNLWFASLGNWREYPFVVDTEARLLENSSDVLALFRKNPFPNAPPKMVRAVLWQYWFTDPATKRRTGLWWRRELLGDYAPELMREPDGSIGVTEGTAGPPLPSNP